VLRTRGRAGGRELLLHLRGLRDELGELVLDETDVARVLLDRGLGVHLGWVLEIGFRRRDHVGDFLQAALDAREPLVEGRELARDQRVDGAAHVVIDGIPLVLFELLDFEDGALKVALQNLVVNRVGLSEGLRIDGSELGQVVMRHRRLRRNGSRRPVGELRVIPVIAEQRRGFGVGLEQVLDIRVGDGFEVLVGRARAHRRGGQRQHTHTHDPCFHSSFPFWFD
jgi:hypothetical protein